jgi:hypothetical protein
LAFGDDPAVGNVEPDLRAGSQRRRLRHGEVQMQIRGRRRVRLDAKVSALVDRVIDASVDAG